MHMLETVMLFLVVVPLALVTLDAAVYLIRNEYKYRKDDESEHTQR